MRRGMMVILALVTVGSLIGCGGTPKRQVEIYVPDDGEAYNYLAYLPEGYDADTTKKWPTILFLHGLMQRGDDLGKNTSDGLPKVLENGYEIPFIAISPQLPDWTMWEPDRVSATMDDAMARYRIDPDRITVAGHSMGGAAAYEAAVADPDRYAAIVALSCWGPSDDAAAISHIPVWAFHGAADLFVPLPMHQGMVNALRDAGGQVKFTTFANAHHISADTFRKDYLYEWIAEQRRK